MMPTLILGTPKNKAREKALHLMELAAITHRVNHKPSQLSGGEQQRVAIARALINSPSLLLADEPTGNLDEKNTEIVSSLLKDVCQREKSTLIMVTHNTSLSQELDHLWELSQGKLLAK